MPITCLENVVSNAERRALAAAETPAARVTDIYAALPAMTGKFELEYEGELRGADSVARELIGAAVGAVFGGWFDGIDTHQVVEWFELGGTLQESDATSSEALVEDVSQIHGLLELAAHAGAAGDPPPLVAAAVDFVLEGLCAQRKISRSEGGGYEAVEKPRPAAQAAEAVFDHRQPLAHRGKKKYYN